MKKLLFFTGVVIMFVSCTKNSSETFVPYIGHPLNDTVWAAQVPADAAANRIPSQFSMIPLVDSFDASVTSILHYNNNVEITIPSNSCVLGNGDPVTGNVVLEMTYLQTKGDFIRYARPTTSYTKVMETGGAFHFTAMQNGQEVYLKPGKRMIISFVEPNPINQMQVYYGLINPTPPFPSGTNPLFTWYAATDSSRVSTFTRVDTTGVVTGYNIFSGKFGWVSCDYLFDSTLPKTRMTAVFPANYTNTNTTVYAVFKNSRTVVQLFGDAESRSFFAPGIPLNSEVKVVSISLRGTEFYLGTKDIVVNDNTIVSVAPEYKTKDDIALFLEHL